MAANSVDLRAHHQLHRASGASRQLLFYLAKSPDQHPLRPILRGAVELPRELCAGTPGVLLGLAGPWAKMAEPATSMSAPASTTLSDRIVSDAAVDFDAKVEADLVAQFGEVGDLVDGKGKELLAAEAGVDAHDEHMVHHRKDFDERLDRRGGVDDDAGQHAVVGDELEGAVQVAADLLTGRRSCRRRLRRRRG